MSEEPKTESNLTDEFRNLGKNLVDMLNSIWESPERKRLQGEIETGLTELGTTLKREADQFASSPTGQQMKSDFEDLGERLRSGEVQTKARQELLTALQNANMELKKVIENWSASQKSKEESPPPENPADKAV